MIGWVDCSAPSALKARKKATIVETPTDAHATTPINRSLRRRRPTSQLMTAPASGAKMIRLSRLVLFTTVRVLVLCTWCFVLSCLRLVDQPHQSAKYEAQSSQLQNACVINIK